MKAAVIYGPKILKVEEVEDPQIGPDEVLVRVRAAGICGSDLHYHRSADANPQKRRAGGHEFSATVAAIGDNVTHVNVGERVGVEPLVGCGNCRYCASGKYHICKSLRHLSGGFGEYTVAPKNKVFKIPEHISFEAASILDCVAVGVHAVQQAKTEMVDTAVVQGDAAIGLCTAQIAKANGARRVIVVGHHDSALEIAKKVGVDFVINGNVENPAQAVMDLTNGLGADVVYESVGGNATTLEEAQDMVCPGGTIVVIGSFRRTPELNLRKLLRNEVNLLFGWSYATWNGIPEFQIAIDLLADGRVDTESLVTHKFPLNQVSDAFHAALDKYESGAVKVLVMP